MEITEGDVSRKDWNWVVSGVSMGKRRFRSGRRGERVVRMVERRYCAGRGRCDGSLVV